MTTRASNQTQPNFDRPSQASRRVVPGTSVSRCRAKCVVEFFLLFFNNKSTFITRSVCMYTQFCALELYHSQNIPHTPCYLLSAVPLANLNYPSQHVQNTHHAHYVTKNKGATIRYDRNQSEKYKVVLRYDRGRRWSLVRYNRVRCCCCCSWQERQKKHPQNTDDRCSTIR